jgi:hypothetical protein
VAEVGDTGVGVAKSWKRSHSAQIYQVATSQATNHVSEAAIVFIELATTKGHPKRRQCQIKKTAKLRFACSNRLVIGAYQ